MMRDFNYQTKNSSSPHSSSQCLKSKRMLWISNDKFASSKTVYNNKYINMHEEGIKVSFVTSFLLLFKAAFLYKKFLN
ncbi:hypothetical protein KFK09_008393 [Dendrobium nobile]|uniref:Uncharacterized protein n=1 Tax=Dendrobium nobile TaxID=94219 RepID=A0A8T3BPC3_DENNO|nr:hypothetical protein KFK09_008393 [Dendrobium nobile]